MIRLCLVLLTSLFLSCHCSNKSTGAQEQHVTTSSFDTTGYKRMTVVNMSGLDGCTFLLMDSDSSFLEPGKMDQEFQKDQLKVWVKVRLVKDRMSSCMKGTAVDIVSIKLAGK
jgi:hypothetical protein